MLFMTAVVSRLGRKDDFMARYVNGLELDDDNKTQRVVTQDETVKYYPKFRNTPNPEKVNPKDSVVYDGGTVEGW